jgi:hypothetical protein
MKRFQFGILMMTLFLLVSACGAPKHMLFKDDPAINVFNIKPEKGKSALVVVRTARHNDAVFFTYLDKKMIGVTDGRYYFVKTDVAPGVHYVITTATNVEPVKIKFEPNRVYYIHERPWQEILFTFARVALVTPTDLSTSFDSDCRLVVYDNHNPGDDMSDKDYQKALNDYERELKEGHHKGDAGYKGVPAK